MCSGGVTCTGQRQCEWQKGPTLQHLGDVAWSRQESLSPRASQQEKTDGSGWDMCFQGQLMLEYRRGRLVRSFGGLAILRNGSFLSQLRRYCPAILYHQRQRQPASGVQSLRRSYIASSASSIAGRRWIAPHRCFLSSVASVGGRGRDTIAGALLYANTGETQNYL
jgi:hypothetical protein